MKANVNWTPREIMLLRMGWHLGISARFISYVIGAHRTRNSVIAKANRLCLAERVAGSHDTQRHAREATLMQANETILARIRAEEDRKRKEQRVKAALDNRPRDSKLCRQVLGRVDGKRLYCRNTAQPGRDKCAEHLPVARVRANQIAPFAVNGASSIA